jgi:hypothetical protein
MRPPPLPRDRWQRDHCQRLPDRARNRACDQARRAGVRVQALPDAWKQGPHRAVVAHTAIAFVLMLALELRLAA